MRILASAPKEKAACVTEDPIVGSIPAAARWRYTNGPTTFAEARVPLFFQLRMDTWYWSESEIDGREALIGAVDLGEAPLTLAQGVSAFLIDQMQAFQEHCCGVLRPRALYLYTLPELTGVGSEQHYFRVPNTAEDAQALQEAIDRLTSYRSGVGDVSVDAIHGMAIISDMFVTIRDERSAYQDLWLPWAGTMWYHANDYWEGYIPPTHGVVGTHVLSSLAKAGRAVWSAKLASDFLSLFRPDNSEVLDRVRAYWQAWLQGHPSSDLPEDSITQEELEEAEEKPHEAYVMTLAEPPDETPPDNQDLYERNWPRLQAVLQRWQNGLHRPFEWKI
jgi:hypothetical protein